MIIALIVFGLVAIALNFWLLIRKPPVAVPVEMPSKPQAADFHVDRFALALEQCQKPAKRAELKKNLAYWRAVQAANRLKG